MKAPAVNAMPNASAKAFLTSAPPPYPCFRSSDSSAWLTLLANLEVPILVRRSASEGPRDYESPLKDTRSVIRERRCSSSPGDIAPVATNEDVGSVVCERRRYQSLQEDSSCCPYSLVAQDPCRAASA